LFLCSALATQWMLEDQINHPSKRGAATMDAVNGRLVLFGGFDECFDVSLGCDHVFFNDVWQYQVDFNTWFQGNPNAPKPDPRAFIASHHYVLTDSIIYFGGGRYNVTVSFFQFYNDIWQYFPSLDQWVKRTPVNAGPSPRLGPELVILEHVFYVFGGVDNTFVTRNDLWKYNLLTNTWTLLKADGAPGSPGARHSAKMELRVTPSVQQIVMFGGNAPPTGSGNQDSDTWIYNIQANSWQVTPAVPDDTIGRTYGASALYNDKFIVALGDIKNDTIACRTNEASGGQLPTSGTAYLNFRDRRALGPNWDYEKAMTERAPRLKRIAYAQFQKKLWVWGGFNFVCPCNIFNGTVEWNTRLFSLEIDQLTD